MQVLVGGNGMQTSLVKTGRPTGIEGWRTGALILKVTGYWLPSQMGLISAPGSVQLFYWSIYNVRKLKRKSTGSLKPHYLCLTCPLFALPPAPPMQCPPIYMSPPSPLLKYKGDTAGMSPLLKDTSLVCWIFFLPTVADCCDWGLPGAVECHFCCLRVSLPDFCVFFFNLLYSVWSEMSTYHC